VGCESPNHGRDALSRYPVIEAQGTPLGIVRLRRATFAIAADLVLVDGRMEPSERRFLNRLAADLNLDTAASRAILNVMSLKNSV